MLDNERYVSLSTWTKDGNRKRTPVWIALLSDGQFGFTTGEKTWKVRRIQKNPIVEMLIPSTVDSSLAPEGKHVASLFCQQFAPTLPDNRSWHDEKHAAADTIIETVNRFAPNFKDSILGMSILSPLDLEEKLGLVGGDIMHGVMSLDQMWAARPVFNYGDYKTPVKNLFICGSGAHPGGGVTGLPGKNSSREILKA